MASKSDLVKSTEHQDVDESLNESQMIDLTAEDSQLETTMLSETTEGNNAVLDELPSEASFTKYLEDHSQTGKYGKNSYIALMNT